MHGYKYPTLLLQIVWNVAWLWKEGEGVQTLPYYGVEVVACYGYVIERTVQHSFMNFALHKIQKMQTKSQNKKK